MKHFIRKRIVAPAVSALLCVPIALGTLAGCGGGSESDGLTDTPDSAAISYVDMGAVANTDAYASNALDKEIDYLLSLNMDRLLYNFRANAGIPVTGVTRYGGWENSLIAGHTMGHYLSALAQAYANGGTAEAEKKQLKTRLDDIVTELKICQDESYYDGRTTGAQEGFLWGGNKTHPTDVEFQFDNAEIGKTVNINDDAWVPWYTMHKIIAGLLDAYKLAGNAEALTVAKRLGDWTYDRVMQWTEATRAKTLATEYGGMNDCLYNLYAVTGETKYAVAAHQFDEDVPTQGSFSQTSMVDLMYDNDTDSYLQGQHANTTIPKVIGLLNGYIQTQGKTIAGVTDTGTRTSKPSMYLQAAENFWTRVVEHLSYVTGGNSEDEHFKKDDSQNRYRDNINCETCNTYNMLKLSRMLFSVTKDKKYLDYYENTYINAILSSQNPETGMTMYFQPMGSGYYKTYSTAENSFWCCTGSGMESMSKLNDSIYYTAGNATYVAMYMSSSYISDAVSFTATADLENSDKVTFEVQEGETILRLRRPDWTTKFELALNGEPLEAGDGDFVSVHVSRGAILELTLGKQITMHNLPDAQNVYAFKYGPYVLSAELGTENMNSSTHGWGQTIEVPNKLAGLQESYNISNNSMTDFKANINTYMTRGQDGKFTLTGIDDGPLTYSIHYKQHTQRYSLYFRFIGLDAAPEENNGYEDTTIESVQPGRGQYETDDRIVDNGSTGADSETSRYANAGGSFSYYMGVDKSKADANFILTNFMKADNGKTIKMSVNGTEIYSATLNYNGADTMYEVYIPIPKSIVEGAASNEVDGNTMDRILIKIESKTQGQASARIVSTFSTLTRELKKGGIAYFVNCGDNNVNTLSEGDVFGLYQSVTDQAYAADARTGRNWGVVDEYNETWGSALAYSATNGADANTLRGHAPDGGVSTKSTWAQEGIADGVDKTVSNRYTKNQYECGLSPKLTYKFELPNGTYTVKVYFACPWPVCTEPSVSANGTTLTNCATDQELSLTATVSNGTLTLNFTTANRCINVAYIIIALA